ncbi:hypothetical protein ACJJTC_006744 [Scirpophaga incertulas]
MVDAIISGRTTLLELDSSYSIIFRICLGKIKIIMGLQTLKANDLGVLVYKDVLMTTKLLSYLSWIELMQPGFAAKDRRSCSQCGRGWKMRGFNNDILVTSFARIHIDVYYFDI